MHYRFQTLYKTADRIELHYTQDLKQVFLHTHDYYEFCITLKPNIVNVLDGRAITMTKNEMLFIRPENQHLITTADDSQITLLNISIQREFFEECWQYLFGDTEVDILQIPVKLSDKQLADYQSLFLNFHLARPKQKQYQEKKLVFELIFLFHRLQTEKSKNKTFPEWLENVISYFKNPANYTKVEGLENVYQLSGYSKPQFNKLFKKYTNKSPIQYYNACKLESARLLLLESNLSIAHIAYYLGFNSTAHFIHLFKRFYEQTPLHYRKTYSVEEN